VKANTTSAVGKHARGARVLTSDECAQIIAELQKKKERTGTKRLKEREKKTGKRNSCKREG